MRHRPAPRRVASRLLALAAFAAIAALPACNGDGGTGPGGGPADDRGRQLTTLGYLRNGPEWSLDGAELFVNFGALAPAGEANRILAIDVQTGIARVAVTHATCPIAELGPVPTTAGLVYFLYCGGNAPELRLRRPDGRDTLLAPRTRWAMRLPDPSRIVYGVAEEVPCGSPCFTIAVIDLVTAEADTVPLTAIPVWPDPITVSPDGTELLFCTCGQPEVLYRLSLISGTWSATDRSDWGWRAAEVIGWGGGGVWAVLASVGIVNALTGETVAALTDFPEAVTTTWHARGYTGTSYGLYHQSRSLVAPNGGALALWSTECVSISRDTDNCDAARYSVWWFDLSTGGHRRIAYGTASAASSGGGDPYWQTFGGTAVSPDGRMIAYVMQGDIYVRALP